MSVPESLNAPAEDFLCENGFAGNRSDERRIVLGCLACRWKESLGASGQARTYGGEITRCTGKNSSTVGPSLKRLEASGILTSQMEDVDPREQGRPRRRYYSPAETPEGKEFETLLVAPPAEACNVSLESFR